MRAIVQRVSSAQVVVDDQVVGRCGEGLLLLVGVHIEDTPEKALALADKISKLRIFPDQDDKMNLALGDLPDSNEPNVLAVSNFTVYGDTKKNRRPSFTYSAPYERGKELFDLFVSRLKDLDCRVEAGIYGANMQVSLKNEGPITVIVEN
jgi:D-tyrosyl-tRNA(Tyr) deacylase